MSASTPVLPRLRVRGLARRATAEPRLSSPVALQGASDEELIARVADTDEAALAALYERFGGTAYGVASRVLRDPALAEDAVQEAFAAVWRGASSFRADRGSGSTWLMTLVHRRAVDGVRRAERRRTESIDSAPEPTGEATEETVERRERRRQVQAALAELVREQRDVLELAYYGGYTQAELAERLGVPLGTVKSRMFTGLASLRVALAAQGLEP